MPHQQDPWSFGSRNGRGRAKRGFLLWLALLLIIGILVWVLADRFPGQISSAEDRGYLIRSIALLAFVSSGLIFARHFRFGEIARNIAIWAGVALVLIVGYAYQSELKDVRTRIFSEFMPGSPVSIGPNEIILTESPDGHFYAVGEVNGTQIRFLIDTGATETVLSPSDARHVGIDIGSLQFTRAYQTANGLGRGAPLRVGELSIGPFSVLDMQVSVNQADMGASLLGMSFLSRLESFEIRDRRLILRGRETEF